MRSHQKALPPRGKHAALLPDHSLGVRNGPQRAPVVLESGEKPVLACARGITPRRLLVLSSLSEEIPSQEDQFPRRRPSSFHSGPHLNVALRESVRYLIENTVISALVLVGIVASVFVGFNIGGSSTGVAWGPAVGAQLVRKTTAAGLTTVLVLLGGWTVGRNVITTLAEDIVAVTISLEAGVAILFFIGLGILIANLSSVPVPTSMTTVASISGLGLATDTLNFQTIGWIVTWWMAAPIIGFLVGLFIGRYLYPTLSQRFQITSSKGPLLVLDRSGSVPTVALGPNTKPREVVGTALVFAVSCYMAFSAGASNIPNAVAPLVSSNALGTDAAILIATGAIGIGAATIARRTMESVGTELTDISLFAAVIVMITSASITTGFSYLGVPISLTMATVMTIAGLGWGRATRPIGYAEAIRGSIQGEVSKKMAVGALTVRQTAPIAKIGEKESRKVLEEAGDLFDRQALARYISLWVVGPSLSLGLSYGFFLAFPFVG